MKTFQKIDIWWNSPNALPWIPFTATMEQVMWAVHLPSLLWLQWRKVSRETVRWRLSVQPVTSCSRITSPMAAIPSSPYLTVNCWWTFMEPAATHHRLLWNSIIVKMNFWVMPLNVLLWLLPFWGLPNILARVWRSLGSASYSTNSTMIWLVPAFPVPMNFLGTMNFSLWNSSPVSWLILWEVWQASLILVSRGFP